VSFAENTGCDYADNLLKKINKENEGSIYFRIGYALNYGHNGCSRNKTIATKWLSKAAEQNYPSAYRFLFYNYHGGYGVKIDDRKAGYWLKKAEKAGEIDYIFVAIGYFSGKFGYEKNNLKMIEAFKKGADLNQLDCLPMAAGHFLYGIGVKKDFKLANKYILNGLKLCDPASIKLAGDAYLHGLGRDKNDMNTKIYYKASVMLGYKKSEFASKEINSSLEEELKRIDSKLSPSARTNTDNEAYEIYRYCSENKKNPDTRLNPAIKYFDITN